MRFGIVGLGRFGRLWADALTAFGEVLVYDLHTPSDIAKNNITVASLQEVARAEMVFLLVPISAFKQACESIKPYLGKETVVIDGCSVKVYPAMLMQTIFSPTQPLIATHPLFGPDSVKQNKGLKGLNIVVCPLQGASHYQTHLVSLLKEMQLTVLLSTPEDHDKQMARSQALVHFIGRGLSALALAPQVLATPDFQALLHINSMVMHDSGQLFLDMHHYNPYTRDVRKKFIAQLLQVHEQIEAEDIDDHH